MRERFWKFIESKWFLRILSLAFAVAVWFYVNESKRSIISIEVPLNFVNLPQNMMIVKFSNSTVNVRITGAKWLLEGIESLNPKAEVDLKGVVEGVNLVSILPEYIKVPSYAEVTLISPSMIEVEVERIISKKVKVKLNPGEHNPYYEVSVLICSPCEVILRGPRSAVEDEDEISLYFKIEKWEEGIYKTTLKPVSDIINAEFNPPRIEVEYKVSKKKETKVLSNVLIRTSGFKVYPDRVKLTIRGWVKALEELDSNRIKVSVDRENIKHGRAVLKVDVPDDIEVLKVEPSKIKVF